MPLLEMSPNVQEAEGGRKRSHDEYADEVPLKVNGADGTVNVPNRAYHTSPFPLGHDLKANLAMVPALLARVSMTVDSTDESLASLTDGTAMPPRTSPSPNPHTIQAQPAAPAPTTDSSNPANEKPDQPAAKRKRLTPAEKAARAEEEARKKKEREEARQQKLAEKARIEKEKAAAKAARQAEKARREEAEQEARAVKQQERDEKRRKKEEEERRAREEKERKERSQLKLQSFFKKPSTPKAAAASPAPGNDVDGSPSVTGSAKKERTPYERMFQPFFVKEHVRMARHRPWLDDETADAKARILDEYVSGDRGEADVLPFKPLEALQVVAKPQRKGRSHPPVRDIMEELQTNPSALDKLRRIPMKLICFRQDVRPPYYGTLTAVPHQLGPAALARAARRPNGRVLELLYDYDSEAEWQDDEPGDDLDDMDDEEEDLDEDDDMDGFLDDSEDTGVARRVFAQSMEPVSTGPCWEGGDVHPDLKAYRMEVILGASPLSPFTLLPFRPTTRTLTKNNNYR